MRLCGHDCLVSGRYDPGSAGSGRYFYRLDPQDPLNFGRNFLSLSYTLASGQRPPCRLRNWHTHCSWRYTGTEKKRIGNARVRPIVFLTTSVRDHLTHWHKGGRQGAGLGFTLVSTKRGSRNDTVPQPMFTRVLSRLSLNLAERAVLRYIKQNPGHQLFMINDATLKSHHSWGTKSVLSDLERHGKIYVRRFRPVRVKGDITVKKIKPLYYAADRYHG
jgi:hypothetical protein